MWLSARGLDPAAIGIVLAAFQVVRVVGTPAGTRLADRYGSLQRRDRCQPRSRRVAAIALLGSASGFAAILVAAATCSAFVSAPMLPLIDAYGLKGLAQRGARLRPGAAVGLGRVHRGEPDRRRAARRHRATAI